MPEQSAIDNQALLRRTLLMMGVMVGACVLIVGTLTLVASAVVGHVVGAADDTSDGGASSSATAGPQHPAPGRPKPGTPDTNAPKKK